MLVPALGVVTRNTSAAGRLLGVLQLMLVGSATVVRFGVAMVDAPVRGTVTFLLSVAAFLLLWVRMVVLQVLWLVMPFRAATRLMSPETVLLPEDVVVFTVTVLGPSRSETPTAGGFPHSACFCRGRGM